VRRLGWLSGDWVSEANGRWTEESWTEPRGGMMLGISRSGRGERATGFEFMRIGVAADGVVTFWGSPQGKPAVAFRLAALGKTDVAFENPDHDFPTQIAYRREGDTLTATISGPNGASAQSWTYRRG
jgi:hypothetical protein